MNRTSYRIGIVVAGLFGLWETNPSVARISGLDDPAADGAVSKEVLKMDHQGPNLLKDSGWQPFSDGFRRERDQFVCDNGRAFAGRRGAVQRLPLRQSKPQPIVATAWSKAEGVGGTSDADYSLYLDLVYDDGSELWAKSASFKTGTHDWQQVRLVI